MIKKIIVSFLGIAVGLFSLGSLAVVTPNDFSSAQTKAIERTIENYLLSNPEVIVNALTKYQQSKMVAMQQESKALVTKYAKEVFDDTGRPVAGDAKSDLVLVEFFDYQCPHCKVITPTIDNMIKANPNLKVIFFEWPIEGENSLFAARAAVASVQQSKFYLFHQALFQKDPPLNKDDVLQIAKSVGLDIVKLQKDLEDKSVDKQLTKNFMLAEKLKLIGTPTIILGNTKTQKYNYLIGIPDQAGFQKEIDALKSTQSISIPDHGQGQDLGEAQTK